MKTSKERWDRKSDRFKALRSRFRKLTKRNKKYRQYSFWFMQYWYAVHGSRYFVGTDERYKVLENLTDDEMLTSIIMTFEL